MTYEFFQLVLKLFDVINIVRVMDFHLFYANIIFGSTRFLLMKYSPQAKGDYQEKKLFFKLYVWQKNIDDTMLRRYF